MKGDNQVNSFDTQIQVEELEMKEPIYYDTRTEEYITESDLFEEYEKYLFGEYEKYLDEGNYDITFAQYVNACLTVNGGTLERVGF